MKHTIRLILFVWIALSFRQSDLAAQWQLTNFSVGGFTGNYPDFPILTTTDSLLFEGAYSYKGLAFRSNDWGDSWDTIGSQLPVFADVSCIAYFSPYLFLNTDENGTFRSSDFGNNWARIDIEPAPYSMLKKDTFIFAATNGGLYRSSDSGTTWTRLVHTNLQGNAAGFYSLASLQNLLFTGNDYGEIYRSSNDGDSWIRVDSIEFDWSSSSTIEAMAVIGNVTLAGASSRGNFRSTDKGNSWNGANEGLNFQGPNSFVTYDSLVFTGTSNGVFLSKDSGKSWSLASPNTWGISSLTIGNNMLFAGTKQEGIWRRPLAEFSEVRTTNVPSSEIEIFPNPTAGYITIRDASERVLHVSIENVMGVETGTGFRGPGNGEISLDLSKLPSGTYFLQIETEKEMVMRKVVKD